MAKPDEYTKDDLMNDLNFLIKKGLIEAHLENGEWVYRATEFGRSATEEQVNAMLVEDEIEGQ